MSRRLNTHTAKRPSAFSSLIQAHQQAHGAGESETTAQATTPAAAPGNRKGKSSDPDYVKLTSYVRRDTHLAVKKRLLNDGDREISELVEELLTNWLQKGS